VTAQPSLVSKVRSLPGPARVLFLGTFINKFGNFLAVFLVLYLTARGYSAGQAGIALGLVGLGNAVGNAIGGTVADNLGRRAAIAISMFGCAALTAAVPLVHGYAAVTTLVALVGVFAQLYRPASGALLLDVVPDEQRVIAFAVYRLAINVGMAAGPIVGGVLAGISFNSIFVGDAISSAIYGVLALTLLPETSPKASVEEVETRAGYRQVLGDTRFVLFLLAMVAATFVYIQSTATLPLHVHDHGLSKATYGLLLGLNALLVVLLELPLTHYLERRDATLVIAAGLVLLGAGFAFTAAASTLTLLVASVVVWTFAEMVYTPMSSAHPGRFAPSWIRGRYQGAYGFSHTIGATLGPALGGLLYAVEPSLLWLTCGLVGVGAAALVLAGRPERPAEPVVEPVEEPLPPVSAPVPAPLAPAVEPPIVQATERRKDGRR
jgi:MFS family permease